MASKSQPILPINETLHSLLKRVAALEAMSCSFYDDLLRSAKNALRALETFEDLVDGDAGDIRNELTLAIRAIEEKVSGYSRTLINQAALEMGWDCRKSLKDLMIDNGMTDEQSEDVLKQAFDNIFTGMIGLDARS